MENTYLEAAVRATMHYPDVESHEVTVATRRLVKAITHGDVKVLSWGEPTDEAHLALMNATAFSVAKLTLFVNEHSDTVEVLVSNETHEASFTVYAETFGYFLLHWNKFLEVVKFREQKGMNPQWVKHMKQYTAMQENYTYTVSGVPPEGASTSFHNYAPEDEAARARALTTAHNLLAKGWTAVAVAGRDPQQRRVFAEYPRS